MRGTNIICCAMCARLRQRGGRFHCWHEGRALNLIDLRSPCHSTTATGALRWEAVDNIVHNDAGEAHERR